MAGMLEQAQAQAASNPRSPTGDHDMNRPTSPEEAFRSAQLAMQPGASAATAKDQPATPEEQQEYERAEEILASSLYEGEAADGVSQMLTPEEKVGSVAKASMFILTALDNQHDFDETVIAQLTQDAVGRVIEIYEAQNGDEFSESEEQAALGSAWEGLMEVYGVSPNDYADLTQGLDKKGFRQIEQEYQGMVQKASD